MSYYIDMYFKKVDSLDEAVKTLNDFIKEYSSKEVLERIVEEHFLYIYGEMRSIDKKIKWEKEDPIDYYHRFQYIFQPLLTFKALYWPEFKLLGLCLDERVCVVGKYFDDMICFQNGCDQNYDYGIWNVLGDYFINKSKEYEHLSVEEIIKIFDYLDEDDFKFKDEETKEHRLDYFRKSAMYRFVWSTLDLEKWLCDKESYENTFIPLNLCVPLCDGNNESVVYNMLMKTFEMYRDLKKEGKI